MSGHDLPIGMRPIPGTLLKQFAIYILTNRPRGVLYVGLSSSLAKRVRQHREGLIPGFTKRYNLTRLVYYEYLSTAAFMTAREKAQALAQRLEDRGGREDKPDLA